MAHMSDDYAAAQSFRVRSPQAGDAVGGALRAGFGGVPSLPEDMLTALRRMDAERRSDPR